MADDNDYPSQEECAALADKFFAHTKSFLPDKGWSLLSEQERAALIDQRMRDAAKRTAAPQVASRRTELFRRMIAATDQRVLRMLEDLGTRLHAGLDRKAALIDMKITERLDNMQAHITRAIADANARPMNYVATLERHITELQTQLRDLEREVNDLKRNR